MVDRSWRPILEKAPSETAATLKEGSMRATFPNLERGKLLCVFLHASLRCASAHEQSLTIMLLVGGRGWWVGVRAWVEWVVWGKIVSRRAGPRPHGDIALCCCRGADVFNTTAR